MRPVGSAKPLRARFYFSGRYAREASGVHFFETLLFELFETFELKLFQSFELKLFETLLFEIGEALLFHLSESFLLMVVHVLAPSIAPGR
jgi:hypothetical protein